MICPVTLRRFLVDLDGVVTSIAATKNATCALMSDERVKCWGESLEGALGYNDTAVVGDSDNQMGVHLPPVELGKDAAGNPRRVKALSAGGALVSHCARCSRRRRTASIASTR